MSCKPHYVPKLLVTKPLLLLLHLTGAQCSHCLLLRLLGFRWEPSRHQVVCPSNKRCEKYWAGAIYMQRPVVTSSGRPAGKWWRASNKDEKRSRQQYAAAGSETHVALFACIVTCSRSAGLDLPTLRLLGILAIVTFHCGNHYHYLCHQWS